MVLLKRIALWILLALVSLIAGLRLFGGPDMLPFLLHLPTNRDVLQWSVPTRDITFRHLDWVPTVKNHVITRGATVRAFGHGVPLAITASDGHTPFDLNAYMAEQRAVGVLVLVNGQVRLENYGMNYGSTMRWTSFSVAKSFTSSLLGAAIKDGYIKSVDQLVTDFIPEFKGTGYDGVTIRQVLTMTSGVHWVEDYNDPHSDVAQFDHVKTVPGEEAIVTYLKKLPREFTPGTKWVYKTGETGLIGVIVSRATKQPLADYLSKKIWAPYGMEQNGFWLLDKSGHEIGGCCISATLADYARIGQLMLENGKVNGNSIFPNGWIEAATHTQTPIGIKGHGYGYQWWTYEDGSYAAMGHYGQGIVIDPKRKLILAFNSDYPSNKEPARRVSQLSFFRQLQRAVDKEQDVQRAVVPE